MSGSVLVVEDESGVRDLVRRYLERDGYSVIATGSGAQAVGWLEQMLVDLAVLDLGLPDVPGEEVLRVAAGLRVPVVVLTSRAEVDDRVHGLELGAADYVGKPFSPRELVLRVRAVLGRGAQTEHEHERSYDDGKLRVWPKDHVVERDGRVVDVTPTEWSLLLALLSRPGQVFSREELASRLHADCGPGDDRTIASHVKNLRHKLGEDGRSPAVVQTVPGFGYRCGVQRDG